MLKDNPNYGKHFSDEIKQIMSDKKKIIYNGEGNPRAQLTNEQAKNIRNEFKIDKISEKDLSIKYNVKQKVIHRILINQTYKENNK